MRKFVPLLLLATFCLSGCAGWVVFGHTMGGGEEPTASATSAATDAKASSSKAPDAAGAPDTAPDTAPAATPSKPTSAVTTASIPASAFKTVAISFTAAAQEKIAAEPRFKQDILLTTVEKSLRSHRLLEDSAPGSMSDATLRAAGTLEIVIDNFAISPTTNAQLFGYNLEAATLAGDVKVHGADGTTVRSFRAEADSRLATSANGDDANPLDRLYRRFTYVTVQNLLYPGRKVEDPSAAMPR